MAGIIVSEGSGEVNALYGNVQTPITSFLIKRAEALEQESIASKIFKKRASTHWAEGYRSLVAMDDFEPTPENGAYPTNDFGEGFDQSILNYTWKSQFAISQELIEDGNIINLTKRPENFMTAYYRTQERFFAKMLGSALQGATEMKVKAQAFNAKSADGKAFFSNAHKGKKSGTKLCNAYKNAFSEEVLGEMATRMQNMEGDNGETLALTPDTIIIPNIASLKKLVFGVIGSEREPGTANNTYNYQAGSWTVYVWPYLNQFIGSMAEPFILMDSSYCDTADVAVWQERVPLTVRSTLDDNDANVWKGRARFGGGFVDFRGMMAGGLSTGDEL